MRPMPQIESPNLIDPQFRHHLGNAVTQTDATPRFDLTYNEDRICLDEVRGAGTRRTRLPFVCLSSASHLQTVDDKVSKSNSVPPHDDFIVPIGTNGKSL
uniref:Uncharacterized protein n=1 Tax=Ascaris lumbricoides TaxID=6252 RepID=A0A0M3I3S4_ASCLU